MKQRNIIAEDILFAYDALGGIEYLKKHPALLERILLKIVSSAAPQPNIVIDMSQYAPWIDWRQRLQYKEITGPSTSAVRIEHPIEDAKLVSWREPDENAGRNSCIAHDDLLSKR